MSVSAPNYRDMRWDADSNRWQDVKRIIGDTRVTLGPQASDQWLNAPEHLAMVLSRYRAAAALIGDAEGVLEIGCGEGIGAGILAQGRQSYCGLDADADAISVARNQRSWLHFLVADALGLPSITARYDAIVSLDVIEHIPAEHETRFLAAIDAFLDARGVCVIGTPNAAFDHLASPQSRAGHINTYTHERLHGLMGRYFHVVQSFGMQDTGFHLGHPEARHYLLMAGIGPRRG